MATASATEYSKSDTEKTNLRKFGLFVCISMFCFVAGVILLKLESGRSVQVDIKNEAYQTYRQHRQKLDAIGRKYSEELDAVQKNADSNGSN